MKLTTTLLICTLALSGCATHIKQTTFPSNIIKYPELNVQSTAEVGQSMISTSRLTLIPAITIEKDLVYKGERGLKNKPFTLTIPAGKLVFSHKDETGTYYQSKTQVRLVFDHMQPAVDAGVFIPTLTSSPPLLWWVSTGRMRTSKDLYPIGDIPYKNTVQENWSITDGFKRELIYSGISANTVSILYREYIDNIVRPAFSQEFKYDLNSSNEIGFKGARFKVTNASNTGISYVVVKHLD